MNTFVGRIIKVALIVSSAGLLMGNESCGKKPAPEPRALKKIIEVGRIASQPVILPDGNTFDFQFVVNQQIYNVLYESKAFAFRYEGPVIGLGMANDGSVMGKLNLSKASSDFYERTMGKPSDQITFPSKEAYCLFNKPQARINGSVNSFELLGGGGLGLGFNNLGPLSGGGINADFKFDTYQLELQLTAWSPMKNSPLASVVQKSNKTDQAGSFKLNFGLFSGGPSYYYKTPMATVTRKALDGAVNSLKEQLKAQEWFSRVLDYSESDSENGMVTIIGGTNVGMKIGDQLAVYNEITYWQGEPCNSPILYDGGVLGKPIGIVEINGVSPEISSGNLIEVYEDFNTKFIRGAKVMVQKLKTDDPAPAKK